MTTKIFSATLTGLDCQIVEVQADIAQGLPAFNIVGLGDASVQESKERVRASIKNAGLKFPIARKTINLAPAQIRKQGALLDLSIAISVLIASSQLPAKYFEDTLIIGELALSGQLRSIKGALAITQTAQSRGFKKIILPIQNAPEASFINGIQICPVDCLKQLVSYALANKKFPKYEAVEIKEQFLSSNHFGEIQGMQAAKNALIVAAAGGHNVLFEGSPGCGKTILARAFKDILPPMTEQEILETSKIFSIAGLMHPGENIIRQRPFRELHHTASVASIIGGGSHNIRPGEITLAHNGVLFLDEIAEFNPKTLNTLRQPLEDKFITITRIHQSYRFPCNFLLLATMNPCPCGFYNDKKIQCRCNLYQINRYRQKISGPILDRFDLFIRPKRFSLSKTFQESSQQKEIKNIRKTIHKARQIQVQRFSKTNIKQNADMSLQQIKTLSLLKKDAQNLLNQANNTLNLTNRGYLKTIKIARSIADLGQEKYIHKEHIAQALQYRYHSQY